MKPNGDKIALLRTRKGYSRYEFASICGISHTTQARIEEGKVTRIQGRTIRVIADRLQVDPEDILLGNNLVNTYPTSSRSSRPEN